MFAPTKTESLCKWSEFGVCLERLFGLDNFMEKLNHG